MRSIEQIKADIEECSVTGTQKQLDGFWLEWFRVVANGIEPDRLEAVCQAERDGRCAVLPCKPDAVFHQWKKGDDCSHVSRFEGVCISEDGDITYPVYWGEVFTPNDFGKTVFLTRPEAEAALKKETQS